MTITLTHITDRAGRVLRTDLDLLDAMRASRAMGPLHRVVRSSDGALLAVVQSPHQGRSEMLQRAELAYRVSHVDEAEIGVTAAPKGLV